MKMQEIEYTRMYSRLVYKEFSYVRQLSRIAVAFSNIPALSLGIMRINAAVVFACNWNRVQLALLSIRTCVLVLSNMIDTTPPSIINRCYSLDTP